MKRILRPWRIGGRGAGLQPCDCTVTQRLWVRLPLGKMKYSNEAKRGVELYLSKRNVVKSAALPILLCAGYSMKLKKY